MVINKKNLLLSLLLIGAPAAYAAIDCSDLSFEQIRKKVENTSKTLHTVIDLNSCNPENIRDKEYINDVYGKIAQLLKISHPTTPTISHEGEASTGGWALSANMGATKIILEFTNNKNGGHVDIKSNTAYDPFAVAKFIKAAFKAKSNEVTVLLR